MPSFSKGLKWGLLLAIPMWALIFAALPLFAAEPPLCQSKVCVMAGPGGNILEWKLHVQLNDLRGARFVVPPYARCASACAIAVGLGLGIGADMKISPKAIFIPHNMDAVKAERRMPHVFRTLMLSGRPFHYAPGLYK